MNKNFLIFKHLSSFYRSPVGKRVARWERGALEQILPTLFGYYLLQLGEINPGDWLKSSPILKKIYLSPEAAYHASYVSLCAKLELLPFPSDSLDAIFIPHVLEFAEDPDGILQEAYRCLLPEGHLIVLGFNSWSLWGIWKRVKKHCPEVPWQNKIKSIFKVRKLIYSQGLEITMEKTFFYRPPINNKRWQKRLRFLEIMGQYCWPFFGSVYIIVAKKKVLALTPIKPAWKEKRFSLGKLVEPTARQVKHPLNEKTN